MIRLRRFGILVIVLGWLCAGGALAQDEAAPGNGPVIETEEDAPADAQIDRRITDIFAEIDGLDRIDVSVNSGVVLLRGEVAERALAQSAAALAQRVNGVVAVRNEIVENVDVRERIVPVLQRMLDRLVQFVNYLPLLIVALLAFALIGAAGWWIARRDWPWSKLTPNAFIANLLRQLVRLVFLAGGLIVFLDILGATAALGTIAGAAGIVGLAVGFAVRDTVENYIASILLSIRQPFRPSDHILLESHEGHVIKLTSRATILLSPEGNHIRIPNATVFKSVITNFTRNPERRFEFELGIDSESDAKDAIELGLETLQNLDFVLTQPPPDAWIKQMGDSNIVIWYAGWVDQTRTNYARARSEAIRLTKLVLEERGFSLPEPIYRLRLQGAAAEITQAAAALASAGDAAPPHSAEPEDHAPADTSADHTIKTMAERERADSSQTDLLDTDAPTELE